MKLATLILSLALLVITALGALGQTPVRDSFTGPDTQTLEGHLLDTGQSYVRPTWSANGTISLWHGWAVHSLKGFRSTYLVNQELPTDQYAQVSIAFKGDGVRPELKLRASQDRELTLQGGYDPTLGQWFLEANEGYAGSDPVIYPLGTFAEAVGSGQTRLLRLEARDYAVTLLVDGVPRIVATIPQETVYNLDGPGLAGFSLAGSSTTSGTFIDNFEAGPLESTPPPQLVVCTLQGKTLTCQLP